MSWAALAEALDAGRAAEALRLAVPLWRATRAEALADLIDALAAFVESDPRAPRKEPPSDPADLDGWLANVEEAALRIFGGEWWLRDWGRDVADVAAQLGSVDDPRLTRAIVEYAFDPFVVRNIDVAPFVERLVALRDARMIPSLTAEAAAVELGNASARRWARAALENFVRPPPLAGDEAAIVVRGLARYRDAPQRHIDVILDPNRDRDDGAEQVASDALSEIGHPYGEAIALEHDASSGVISAAGRERLETLYACHERRWIGRALFLSFTARSYRGGLLDEATMSARAKEGALADPRIARLRVLRAGTGDWDEPEARDLRESPWLKSSLEWLDVPTFEFLAAVVEDAYPRLVGIRLGRLRQTRFHSDWPSWAPALATWAARLPSLREVVFQSLPEEGLEGLVEELRAASLHERIETFSLDGARWSFVRTGERDVTKWFQHCDGHGIRRAKLYYTDATCAVEWTAAGLVVTLETSEGGPAFDLLRALPKRPIARFVFRDFAGKRARRIEGLGRLRRLLAHLAPAAVEMPVRWKNQLARLPAP